jgi:hypothetical protein
MPGRIVLLFSGALLLVLLGRSLQRVFMTEQAALGAYGVPRLQRGIATLMLAPFPLLIVFLVLYYLLWQDQAWLRFSQAMLLIGLVLTLALLLFLANPLRRARRPLPLSLVAGGLLALVGVVVLLAPGYYVQLVPAEAYVWALVLGLALEISCYAALWALWQGLMRGQRRSRR